MIMENSFYIITAYFFCFAVLGTTSLATIIDWHRAKQDMDT